MRALKVSLSVAALGLGACNPSNFNSVLDHAPVVVTDTGGASTDSVSILPLSPLTGSHFAARAVITRNVAKPYLALASYDGNGKVTLSEDTAAESQIGYGIYSTAVRADGTVLLGVPGFPGGSTPGGAVMTAVPTTAADGTTKFTVSPVLLQGGGHLGISVAAGNITGLPGGDFVAVSESGIQLIPPSGAIPAPLVCQDVLLQISNGGGYAPHPIAVADLLAGGSDEIVLGGQLAGQGVVEVVSYDSSTGTLRCPATKKFSSGSSTNFGSSLAVGDFDGDGFQDLAVGTPPDRVYVYFGPLDAVTDPAVTILSATSSGFGKKLAPLYVAGMASAQLMVQDPGARGGKGEILIFGVSRATATVASTAALATLFDSNDDSDSSALGTSLGTLPFEGGICNAAAGSKMQAVPFASVGTEWLTFFTYNVGTTVSPDPRCFAQAK